MYAGYRPARPLQQRDPRGVPQTQLQAEYRRAFHTNLPVYCARSDRL